jgi:hypothetical protein
MKLSAHASKRFQQRGIMSIHYELIMRYGTPTPKPGDAMEYRICGKDKDKIIKNLKSRIQALEKCTNKVIIVSRDDMILTAYNLIGERRGH